MAYAVRWQSSSSDSGGESGDDLEREPEPEPEVVSWEPARRQLPGRVLRFLVPPDPDARFADAWLPWGTWTVNAPGLLEPVRYAGRRGSEAASDGVGASIQNGWERRSLDTRDGRLDARWLSGALASSAAGPWVFVHTATGDVRFSLPALDDDGTVPPGSVLLAGAEDHMSCAAAAYSASVNHTRMRAIGGRLAGHLRDQQKGDPAACAVHASQVERRLQAIDPDHRNLNELHTLGRELFTIAKQADAVFDRLDVELESTVERISTTTMRIGRLRNFQTYIAQRWSLIEEPLVLYDQPPLPSSAEEPPLKRLSAEPPSGDFFAASSLPADLAAKRERLAADPGFEELSPYVMPTFGRHKLPVLDSEGKFMCGKQFYANAECFNHHFYQQMMAEGKAARAERRARRLKRKEQRKRIIRKIRLLMLLGQGTLARQVEDVLQQDRRCEAIRHARRCGAVGGTEYTGVLPPSVEQLGMTFVVVQALHSTNAHSDGALGSRHSTAAPAKIVVDSVAPKGAAARSGIAVGDELLRVELSAARAKAAGYRGGSININCRLRLAEVDESSHSSCIEEIEAQWTEMQQKGGKHFSDLWVWTFAHRGMNAQQLEQMSGPAAEVIKDILCRAQTAARPGSSEPLIPKRWGGAAADGNGPMGAREANELTLQEWKALGSWERMRVTERFERGDNPRKGILRPDDELRAVLERLQSDFMLPYQGMLHAALMHRGEVVATSDSSLAAAQAMGLLDRNEAAAVAEALVAGKPLEVPALYAPVSVPMPRCVVTQDWSTSHDGYLELKEGDVIVVTGQPEADWWSGYVEGVALGNRVLGDFPSNIVKTLPGFAAATAARNRTKIAAASKKATDDIQRCSTSTTASASMVLPTGSHASHTDARATSPRREEHAVLEENDAEIDYTYCRVKKDYTAGDGFIGYLELRAGQLLAVVDDESEDGWWTGFAVDDPEQKVGEFPSMLVDVLPPSAAGDRIDGKAEQPTHAAAGVERDTANGIGALPRVMVTRDWSTAEEGYLQIEVGDVIVVTAKEEDDWWTGYIEGAILGTGEIGDFPAMCVQELEGSSSPMFPVPPSTQVEQSPSTDAARTPSGVPDPPSPEVLPAASPRPSPSTASSKQPPAPSAPPAPRFNENESVRTPPVPPAPSAPPPPPAGPSEAPSGDSGSGGGGGGGGRDDLLSAIAGGKKLKKTVTVDKSGVPGVKPQPGAPPPPPLSGASAADRATSASPASGGLVQGLGPYGGEVKGQWVNAKPPPTMDMFQEIAWKKKQREAKAEWEAKNPDAAAKSKGTAMKQQPKLKPPGGGGGEKMDMGAMMRARRGQGLGGSESDAESDDSDY